MTKKPRILFWRKQ